MAVSKYIGATQTNFSMAKFIPTAWSLLHQKSMKCYVQIICTKTNVFPLFGVILSYRVAMLLLLTKFQGTFMQLKRKP